MPEAFSHVLVLDCILLQVDNSVCEALELSSSRVKDTLGHTSTPAFSVDSELLCYFPGHADAFQILLYGVYPVLLWSSRLFFCMAYIPQIQGKKAYGRPRTMLLDWLLKTGEGNISYEELKMSAQDRSRWSQ